MTAELTRTTPAPDATPAPIGQLGIGHPGPLPTIEVKPEQHPPHRSRRSRHAECDFAAHHPIYCAYRPEPTR